MVRNMELSLIEDELTKQLSFAKRRNGLIKKALELFLVCGVDCVVIGFSPSGRLSYFFGDKRIEEVLAQFIAVPENIRRLHLSEQEYQELLGILNELKDRSDQDLQNNSTVAAIQHEIFQVKAEIERVESEISNKYEPIPESIMTTEEANNVEARLEETLAKVQERMNELRGNDNDDGSQPSASTVDAAENLPEKPSDEAPQTEYGKQSNRNHGQVPNQPADISQNVFLEMVGPQPDQGLSFSSLMMSPELPETLSPIRPPEQNRNSIRQNQYGNYNERQLHSHQMHPRRHAPEFLHSSGQDQSIYGETNGYMFPKSNLSSPNYQLPSSLASFQVPLQNQLQPSFSNEAAFPPMQPSTYYQSQFLLGESNRLQFSNTPQWPNQRNLQPNANLFGQREYPDEHDMMSPLSGMNGISPSDAESATAHFRPLNTRMNHQSIGGQSMGGTNLGLNLQGLSNGNSNGILGSQMQMDATQGHLSNSNSHGMLGYQMQINGTEGPFLNGNSHGLLGNQMQMNGTQGLLSNGNLDGILGSRMQMDGDTQGPFSIDNLVRPFSFDNPPGIFGSRMQMEGTQGLFSNGNLGILGNQMQMDSAQGPLSNGNLHGILGNQMPMHGIHGNFEAVGSPPSSNKRKIPWEYQDDIALKLSNNQSMPPAPNGTTAAPNNQNMPPAPNGSTTAAPRSITSAVYDPAYVRMGLYVDPILRMFEEYNRKGGSGNNVKPPKE